jgi:hypothetical protein
MARPYKNIQKDESCEIEMFSPLTNYSIFILEKRLHEMIKVYETMKENDTSDFDFRKQKLLIYSKILQVQHSITILKKHQL